ncbi:MAG: hypothetical protein RR454_06160 [Clostridia bacterium]
MTKAKNKFAIALITFLMLAIVINPSYYIKSVLTSLVLYTNSVLPALFPFFILTAMLTTLTQIEPFQKLLKKPFKKLYNQPSISAYIFILSLFCGYPVGAKLAQQYYNNQALTTAEVKGLVAFTSGLSPMFIIGTIGAVLLQNAIYGYLIYCCNLLSALLNGLIFKCKTTPTTATFALNKSNLALGDCLYNSIISLLMVGGFIVFFNLFIDFILSTKFLDLMCLILNKIFPFKLQKNLIFGSVIGLLEITKGSLFLSTINVASVLPLICGLVAFNGVCILLQSMCFLKPCGVTFGYYIKTRLSQSLISFAIASIFCLLMF